MSDPKALAEQGTIWRNLHACLAEQDAHFRESHIFLIERQNSFSFRGALATNPKVMRSFGHLTGAIMARYAGQDMHPLIAEVCPKLKGRMLSFPDHLTYAQTKAASVAQVKEFMTRVNDPGGCGDPPRPPGGRRTTWPTPSISGAAGFGGSPTRWALPLVKVS